MFRPFFFFFYSPSVVSRKESETRRSRNNKIWEAEYSKRFEAPPLEIYYSSLFHFGGAMREPAEGRARRKNSKNFRLPEPRGILRAAWTTLCRDPFIFLSSFSFLSLRPRAPDTRGITARKLGHLVENSRRGGGIEPRALNSNVIREQAVLLFFRRRFLFVEQCARSLKRVSF